jgi:hypothetical protein
MQRAIFWQAKNSGSRVFFVDVGAMPLWKKCETYCEACQKTSCFQCLRGLCGILTLFTILAMIVGANYGIMLLWYGSNYTFKLADIILAILLEVLASCVLVFFVACIVDCVGAICKKYQVYKAQPQSDPNRKTLWQLLWPEWSQAIKNVCAISLTVFCAGSVVTTIWFCVTDWTDARWFLLSVSLVIVGGYCIYLLAKSKKQFQLAVEGYEGVSPTTMSAENAEHELEVTA